MYAICDMAMHIILTRVQSPEVREYTLEYTRIPDMYFLPQPESYQNTKIYIPTDVFPPTTTKTIGGSMIIVSK